MDMGDASTAAESMDAEMADGDDTMAGGMSHNSSFGTSFPSGQNSNGPQFDDDGFQVVPRRKR